jgi:protein gp37
MTSGISWTHYSWNPWLGCDKVAPECAHCYIYRDLRKQKDPDTGKQRDAWGDIWLSKTWDRPWALQRKAAARGEAYRVFTCSHSDFFHKKADGFRAQAWMTIKNTPNLVYLILTKRAERIAKHLPADWGDGYPNVWLGVSTGCNQTLNKMDALRKVPAALRFVSCEPLLEDISEKISLAGFHWLICGGESGDGPEYTWDPQHPKLFIEPGHRTMDLDWARALQRKCAAHVEPLPSGTMKVGLPFYFKQVTATRSGQGVTALDGKVHHSFPIAPKGLRWAEKGE